MLKIQKFTIAWLFFFVSMLIYANMIRADEAPGPSPLVGTFAFADQLEPVSRLDVRIVYGFTSRGREELKELKAEGYTCQIKPRQTYRCLKNFKVDSLNEEIEGRVFQKIEDVTWLEFLDTNGGYETLAETEYYKAWRIHRAVATPHGVYASYEISWTPSIGKVTLREDEKRGLPTVYFNRHGQHDLNRQVTVSDTVDRDIFHIYIVRSIYERGCVGGGPIGPVNGCRHRDSVRQ